jgi:predicted P-loop ATPase
MPKYHVTIRETASYTMTVEAEDVEDAEDVAMELFEQSNDPVEEFVWESDDPTVFVVLEAPDSAPLTEIATSVPYEVLCTTKDGVQILKPVMSPQEYNKFTDEQIDAAIKKALAEDPTKNPHYDPTREEEAGC